MTSEIEGFKIEKPDGAFYVFPDCSYYLGKSFNGRKIENSGDLAMFLLEEGHVACVGGQAFGAPNCIRFSYATADELLVEALKRVKETLAKLK